MREEDFLAELRRLLEILEIEVRSCQSSIQTIDGGLCKIGNRKVLFLNESVSPAAQVRIICRSLRREDLSTLFVLPALRERIVESTLKKEAKRRGS